MDLNNVMLGENWILRVKSLLSFLGIIAVVVSTHMDLLHLGERANDSISLVCIIVMALNNPVFSKLQERK